MATLLITKKTGDYFSFVLNGDYSNEILNTRNDLTVVKSNEAHFKTANGANLIKEQIIYPADVTIVDGATTLNPTTTIQLFSMLKSVGYFDWINGGGGSGGVNRFDELDDTLPYFGNNGKVPVVDEAQMKLIYSDFYNVQHFTDLADVPNSFVDGKWLRSSGSGLYFDDLPPAPTDPNALPSGGYTGTGEDLNTAIENLQTEIDELPTPFVKVPKIQFTADGITATYDIVVNAEITAVEWNGVILNDNDWSQTGTEFTLTFIPSLKDIIKPI